MIRCPICGGEIVYTDDLMRDLKIFQCLQCRDRYAAPNSDICNMGIGAVFVEWRKGYESQRRLVEGMR